MARPALDRIGTLLSLRAEMMADNLLDIAARERDRGPCLVFAHNVHLQRAPYGAISPEPTRSSSSPTPMAGGTSTGDPEPPADQVRSR